MRIGLDLSRLVPRPARGIRRNRARGRAARRRARRRRPRRDALRVRRLADARAARVGLPDGAERMDRAHVLGDAARDLRAAPVGRASTSSTITRDSSALRSAASSTSRSATPFTGRWTGSRVVCTRSRLALAAREADLDLPEPAQAEAGPSLDRELPERARPLRVPVQAKVGRRLPRLPRPDEPRQGRAPRARGRARDRASAQDRRKVPGAARDPLLRRVHPPAPRRLDRVRRRGGPRGQGRAPMGARALISPIDWEEPFGLMMIEAMACGTPVLVDPARSGSRDHRARPHGDPRRQLP